MLMPHSLTAATPFGSFRVGGDRKLPHIILGIQWVEHAFLHQSLSVSPTHKQRGDGCASRFATEERTNIR